jgi:cytochrome c-type biogenesis protein CcmH
VRKLILAGVLVAASLCAWADAPQQVTGQSELDRHVMELSEQLRCLVCQNQTIADSHADLAIDLRNQVREKLASGMSDQAVIDYMVQRYGDFVLYKPPVKPMTWLLWFGPFALVLGGAVVLVLNLRDRRSAEFLPEADMRRAAQLLAEPEKKDKA